MTTVWSGPARRFVTAVTLAAILAAGAGTGPVVPAWADSNKTLQKAEQVSAKFRPAIGDYDALIGLVHELNRRHPNAPMVSTAGRMQGVKAELVKEWERLKLKIGAVEYGAMSASWFFGFCTGLNPLVRDARDTRARIDQQLDTVQVSPDDAKSLRRQMKKTDTTLDGLIKSCAP